MDHVVSEPKAISGLSRAFSRYGWLGFWSQIVVGAIPLVLLIYLFVFTQSKFSPRAGFAFVEYLTLAGMLALALTTFWSYRYTRLAKRIKDPEQQTTFAKLIRACWTGIFISTVGILFSILVMLIEVSHLLFYFLTTPQGGVQVVQTTSAESASWVSAVDMLSLLALIVSLLAELIVLTFSLWLLFRTTVVAARSGVLPDDV